MNKVVRFLSDESGSSTVEFVLWVPLFATLLMMTVDASFMYMNMTRMENAARDGARRLAMGQYDEAAIVPVVLSGLPAGDFNVNANCSTADYACITVRRPSGSMMAFGFFKPLLGQNFGAEIRMRYEPGVTRTTAPDSAPTA